MWAGWGSLSAWIMAERAKTKKGTKMKINYVLKQTEDADDPFGFRKSDVNFQSGFATPSWL